MSVDANEVYPRLYMGSRPGPEAGRRFDVIVLAAEEYQPTAAEIGARTVVHAPLDDGPPMTAREKRAALQAAAHVATAVRHGKRVLVTCNMGLNRSGLITALSLMLGAHVPRERAVALVRRARGPDALANPHFLVFLSDVAR